MWVPDIDVNPGGIIGAAAWPCGTVAIAVLSGLDPPVGGDPVATLLGFLFTTGLVGSAVFGNWLWATAFGHDDEFDDGDS